MRRVKTRNLCSIRPPPKTLSQRCVVGRFVPIYPDNMKHEHGQCTAELKVRVTPTLRDLIERDALNQGRSLGNMARRIIERHYAERGQPEAA